MDISVYPAASFQTPVATWTPWTAGCKKNLSRLELLGTGKLAAGNAGAQSWAPHCPHELIY
eukprot:CAMPEP_0171194756 /NCGR_PEP_ID=MMETSP0790-20130122/21051_1 /TAXON_ID=2925 /ORGANISM="Alexandrium catenella, Strain OF101" /LENGTH=60 /DNA_ID=CAMNT_0011659959 /DNA_START=12 /DNA_END=194 /DNA_ORIENTATION=-